MPGHRKKKKSPLTSINVVKPRAMNLIKRVQEIAKSSTHTGKLHMTELLAVLDFTVTDKTILNKTRSHVSIVFQHNGIGRFVNNGSEVSIAKIPGVTYLYMDIQLNLAAIIKGSIQISKERLELTNIIGISGTVASIDKDINKIIITPGKAEIY